MKRNLFIIVFACVFLTSGSAWAERITICSFGGTYGDGWREFFAEPFTKATGIEVIVTGNPKFPKIAAQVKSGNIEWDIVEAQSRMYARAVKEGFFEPLDLSMIPKEDLYEGAVTQYGVGFMFVAIGIAYNTDKWPVGQGPKSMKDYWDIKKFPGPRAQAHFAFQNLEAATLARGVPRSKAFPIDVDLALEKMTEIKPYILFWKSGGHQQTIMREKEADLGLNSSGRMIQMIEQGAHIGFEWNDNLLWVDYMSILKGSKHKEAAMKFIAFATDPKRQAAFAKRLYYGPSNKKAFEFIDKETAVKLPTYPENFKRALFIDHEWWADNEKEVLTKWETWKMQQ